MQGMLSQHLFRHIPSVSDCTTLFCYIMYRVHHCDSNGSQSIRTQVNSYLSQFVLILVNSYSNFGQFVLIWSIRTHVWSVRTHFGQFVLILVNSFSNSNEYELTKMSSN